MSKLLNLLKLRSFSTAADSALEVSVSSDTQPRLRIDAGGKYTWGAGGTSAGDTNLYRSAADTLKTDDAFIAAGGLTVKTIEIDPSGAASGQILSYNGTKFVPANGATITATDLVAQGRLTGDTSVTPNSDLVIPFVDDFDPQGWWDATAKQFKPTIAGYYNITLQVWWTIAAVTNNQNNIQIRKSGSTVAISQTQTFSGQGYSQNATKLVYLNGTTDYLDFTAYTGNSSAQSLQWGGNSNGQGTFFSAALMTAGKGATGDTGATGPAGITTATVSDAPPSSPTSGQVWFESDTGRTFIYYDSFWIEIGTGASYPVINSVSVTTNSATTIASFVKTDTRSGEFLIQVTQGSKYTVSKILLIHDGTTPTLAEYGVIELGSSRIPLTISTSISGSNVLIQATITDAATTTATVKVTSNLITV